MDENSAHELTWYIVNKLDNNEKKKKRLTKTLTQMKLVKLSKY